MRQPQARAAISTPLTQRDWQDVQAILEQPDGKRFIAVMIYSREWLYSHNVSVGSPIPFNIPKYGAKGQGRVLSIELSEKIPQGEGQVTRFIHLGESEEQALPPIEQRHWQQVHVRCEGEGGMTLYMVFLHSSEWLQRQCYQSGSVFPIDLSEQSIRGRGKIALIEPSPMRSDGEGR